MAVLQRSFATYGNILGLGVFDGGGGRNDGDANAFDIDFAWPSIKTGLE